MKYLWLSCLLTFGAWAKTQVYEYKAAKLTWTAFKTPKKVGVTASFDRFTLKPGKSGTVEDLLNGATIDVETRSINSGDSARDAKISTFFFQKAGQRVAISGKVLSAKDGVAEVAFTINGVTQNVAFKYLLDVSKSELKLNGAIDVLKFALQENLAAITKACYQKHEGVTWPDVELQLIAQLSTTKP